MIQQRDGETGNAFADALVAAMDKAGTELKRLHRDNEALVQQNADLVAFVRRVAKLSDPTALSPIMRLFALNDIQREAQRLLKGDKP